MKGVISVIVPVYNVEAYLEQAVNSITSQDYEQLEILLIDDGSTDRSGRICDALAERDSRIRVIHQKNAGAAAAKNTGLRAATGMYLSFVDSDDYLEPEVYGYMVSCLETEQADAAQFAFQDVYQNRKEPQILWKQRTTVDPKTYLKRFPTDWTCALLWNKLYRRELFRDIYFEEGHRIDDEFFTYQGIMNAGKIVLDSKIIYNYRRRASSAMHSPQANQQRMVDRVAVLLQRQQKISQRFPELKWDFDFDVMNSLVYMAKYPENTPETLKLLKKTLREYLKNRENSRPPRYLWLPMAKLLLTSNQRLWRECQSIQEENKTDQFFA